MAREINLVPDIKNKMLRTLKLRNLIYFICIIVAVASISITAVFWLIMGGQRLALDNKKSTLSSLSSKLNSYSELDDLLTIKDQLGNLSTLSSNKKVLSRTFNILSAIIPTGADTVTVSSLNVDLSNDQPTFSIDAQANAGREPFIDYNVLDSFKKSMQFMRYDYGNYVDKKGKTIPAYCMVEFNDDGSTFSDTDKGYFAFWNINAEGCNPSPEVDAGSYNLEDYNGEQVVKIWRTPQYSEWYKEQKVNDQPYMGLDGEISGVEHFDSACIKYTANIGSTASGSVPKFLPSNEDCLLVKGGTDGITISDSSNGRDQNGELVLRFSASIAIAPEVYSFKNTHMLAIAPVGHRNVTDSYVQIQAMFGERAKDCAEDDVTCTTDTDNMNGEN